MATVNNDILDHYRKIDFSLWQKAMDLYCDKLRKLKKDESKKVWILQLYSAYLQLIEVFCINIFAITENNLWDNLFLSNRDLKDKIDTRFFIINQNKTRFCTKFTTYLLDNWVFGIKEKSEINNLADKRKKYTQMLKEAIEDYLKDYDLLNAYKHGFRVKSHGSNTITIKAETSNAPTFKIGDFNASISYLTKKKDVVSRHDISFNWERAMQKAYFLLNMMENTQKILLNDGKEIQLDTLAVTNEAEFSKHFGASRFKTPLLQLNKQL
ncbi:MAG: hypothetical protein Q8P68_00980 [Candidatus Peregrinibacteria bacterium]|nr:hypothetical protein [Candidatus Peregrinibacteria bacterium]